MKKGPHPISIEISGFFEQLLSAFPILEDIGGVYESRQNCAGTGVSGGCPAGGFRLRESRETLLQRGPDGEVDKTYKDEDERTGEFTITKAWIESEGLVWFTDKVYYHDSDITVYELSKLDLDKMDWNLLWSEEKFPAEWDAVEYPAYFYRK